MPSHRLSISEQKARLQGTMGSSNSTVQPDAIHQNRLQPVNETNLQAQSATAKGINCLRCNHTKMPPTALHALIIIIIILLLLLFMVGAKDFPSLASNLQAMAIASRFAGHR